MPGFFTNKEVQSVARAKSKTYSCVSCGLYDHCNSPKMKPFGNFKKGILNIGETPGETEDKYNKPWQGRAGKLLQKTYEKLGIDLFEDCLNINAVSCRPMNSKGENRTPTWFEVDSCRRFVLMTIEKYKPKLIVLFGQIAVQCLIGYRWKKDLGSISKWRGWTIPDQDFQCWICPVFHPSYVLRSEGGVEEVVFKNDLKQALFVLENTFFPIYKEPTVHITDDLSFLKEIKGEAAFDYEATGLKPHSAGHRIVCCAVAVSEDECYVFLMPKSRKERQPFVDFLEDESIKKIAQNMKYEHAWSKEKLGVEVKGWIYDTMIMAHILDNRPGITNLAFQTYVNFGIVDFKDETQPYLEAGNKKNANSINNIMELMSLPGGSAKLMGRCADDAIFEMRLYKKQEYELLSF